MELTGCRIGAAAAGPAAEDCTAEQLRAQILDSDLGWEYSFLADSTVVLHEGGEVYLLAPREGGSLTIYPSEMGESGACIDDRQAPLYEGAPGETILLRCNVSDLYANVLISADGGACEFRPMLSLKDGKLMANKEAMEALMKIEGFRSLNSDIETIINKSESVKKAKKEKGKELTKEEKREISEEEKEYKSMRKQIQEKLIKFATRVPIFMYLTDYRERSLKDVITQLEPGLFKKVTGLDVKDFNLLVELNVFNASLMNDAIFKFKRYEDSSLSYTGLDKHENEDVGGWDTVVKRKEYELLFYNQQSTMNAPKIDEADVPEADEEPEPPKAPVPPRTPPAKPDFVTAAFGVKSPIVPAKPQQPEKPKVDVSGVAVGSAVAHAKFGIGKVIELNRGYVTVRFEQGEKRFIFPDAFESGFLKAQ